MLMIGFGNRARQGKDSAAAAIIEHFVFQRQLQIKHELKITAPIIQRIGFADALYEEARNEYSMTVKDAPLLQRLGHEKRQVDINYWIKKAFVKIKHESQIVLFPDTRYRNEAEAIKAKGGYVVNVQRLMEDGKPFIAQDRPADHPSEIDLDNWNWDFRLVNKQGHEALLCEQAITLVEYLRGLTS